MMTKIYEVKVATVDCEGRFLRWEHVAHTSTKEIAERVIKEFRTKHQINQYWCHYAVESSGLFIKDGDPIVLKIEEINLNIITE